MRYRNAPDWMEYNEISNVEEIIDALVVAHPYLRGLDLSPHNQLGCGAFGCAYSTPDPRIVLKMTVDKFEGVGVQSLLDTKKAWPGVIKPFFVYKMEHYPPMDDQGNNLNDVPYLRRNQVGPMCIVLTEAVGTDDMDTLANTALGSRRNEAFGDTMWDLQGIAVTEVWGGNHGGDDFWENDYFPMFHTMVKAQPQGMKDIRDTFLKLWKNYSLIFPDLHPGNLGYRKQTFGKALHPKVAEWRFSSGIGRGIYTQTAPMALQLDLGVASGHGIQGHFPKEMLGGGLVPVDITGKKQKRMRGKGHRQLSLFSNPYRYQSVLDSIPSLL